MVYLFYREGKSLRASEKVRDGWGSPLGGAAEHETGLHHKPNFGCLASILLTTP